MTESSRKSNPAAALSKVLLVFAVLLFGFAAYFFVNDNVALGAAMIAIGSSQVTIFAALRAKAKRDAAAGGSDV